ncbi:essential MCU regulator, mitochondrial [Dendroctonus ponderosae]
MVWGLWRGLMRRVGLAGGRNASSKPPQVMAEPHRTPFGLLKVVFTVVPGLLIGAGISKNIANFLEENELFVPDDDDDDDD